MPARSDIVLAERRARQSDADFQREESPRSRQLWTSICPFRPSASRTLHLPAHDIVGASVEDGLCVHLPNGDVLPGIMTSTASRTTKRHLTMAHSNHRSFRKLGRAGSEMNSLTRSPANACHGTRIADANSATRKIETPQDKTQVNAPLLRFVAMIRPVNSQWGPHETLKQALGRAGRASRS